jgi:hypothetical protein
MLPRFFVRLFRKPSDRSPRQARASRAAKTAAFRPRLEALEDRTLLSVLPISGDRPSSIAYTATGFSSVHQETLSSTGRFAVFTSTSDNLVSGPTTGFSSNVYLRDLLNGTNSLVSISSTGTSGVAGGSFANQPVVTPDGRYVAFVSDSPDLTSNSNGGEQVYVRDVQQGQTYLVSLGTDGNPANTNDVVKPSIAETGNGQLVIAYQSKATNLTGTDTNSSNPQVFVTTFNLDAGGNIAYDTRATELASADSTGNGGNGTSDDAILSKDGSTLAFESLAADLAGEGLDNADGHQHVQVFTYNVASGALTQVSPAPPAGQTTDSSWLSSISDNGQYLAYDFRNNNTGVTQVLAWNANADTNTVIPNPGGTSYPGLYATVISGDGSTIAFTAGNAYGHGVIYAAGNWRSGSPTFAQVTPSPSANVFSSQYPSISDNGQVIAYQVTPAGSNRQVYVWNKGTRTEASAARGGDSNGTADTPAVSADGSTVTFDSTASNLVSGMIDIAGEENVFAYNVPSRATSLVSAQGPGISPATMTVVVSADKYAQTAGSRINVTITIKSPSGYSYNGPVSLSTSDGEVVSPAAYTMTNGTITVPLSLHTAGSVTLTAAAGSLKGSSSPITINPAAAAALTVGAPSTVTAGSNFNVTVKVVDAYGNAVPSANGNVTLSSTDGQAVSPNTLTLVNGTATTALTFTRADSLKLFASNGVFSGYSGLIKVNPAAMTVVLSTPATVTAGVGFSAAITVKDAYGNGYNGTVTLASSDGQALNVKSFTMVNGYAAPGLVLTKAGGITLTAAAGSIKGTSAITINPNVAVAMAVSAPASVTAGSSFSVTVAAKDAFGNTVTGFNGDVNLGSTDGQSASPAKVSLSNGTATTAVTLYKANNLLRLYATNGVIGGYSGLMAVSPAAMTVVVSAPSTVTAGVGFTTTITVKDAYGNGYNGLVTLAASDGQALNLTSFTMANGSASVVLVLHVPGNVALTATAGTRKGTSSLISVS